MAKYGIDGELKSGASGSFLTHSLFTNLSSIADMNPGGDDPLPEAFPTRVHEFVHYIQNTSTRTGVRLMYLTHALIAKCNINFIDVNGFVRGGSDDDTQFYIEHMSALMGGFDAPKGIDAKNKVDRWEFSKLNRLEFSRRVNDEYGYTINVKGIRGNGRHLDGVVNIGWILITEGVAFEVEKSVWKRNGVNEKDVENRMNSYPYVLYGYLLDYLVGRETSSEERIKIGNAALLHYSPAMGLVDGCIRLRRSEQQFLRFSNQCLNSFKAFVENDMPELFKELRKFYLHSEFLIDPFDTYAELFLYACKRRVADENIELELTSSDMDVAKFNDFSVEYGPQIVIQRKPQDKAEISLHDFRGGLLHRKDDKGLAAYAIFGVVINFIFRHITMSGEIVPTNNLPPSSCVFVGSCQVERTEDEKNVCSSKPWNLNLGNESDVGKVCWFNAALKAITPQQINSKEI